MHVVQNMGGAGGIESLVISMQKYAKADELVIIVSLEGCSEKNDSFYSSFLTGNTKLIFLSKMDGIQIKCLWQLIKLVWKYKPFVVHTHHEGPLFYGGLAARFLNVRKIIYTEHDTWSLDRRRCRMRYWLFKIIRPYIVADSDTVAENLVDLIPGCKPIVIYNGVDTHLFKEGCKASARKKFGIESQSIIVGTAGRLEQVKGHHVILKAFQYLPDNVYLILAGTGSEMAALQQLAHELNLLNRVTFLGSISTMPLFYQAIDLFCMPSLQEGLPLAPLEAQACSVPVVATKVGAMHEAVCPKTGTLVGANDPQKLAEAISAYVVSKQPLACSPRDFVVSKRDVSSMMKAYREVYE